MEEPRMNGSTGRAVSERQALSEIVSQAVVQAAGALGEMAGREITAHSAELRPVAVSELSMVAGDPERPVVAVYLGIQGDMPGHILLAFSEEMGRNLVDLLLFNPEGTTQELGELEVSALAESGNVAGSAFLNHIANTAQIILHPTPPLVIHEMRGAILDTLAADLSVQAQDEALMVEAQFSSDGQAVDLSLFLFPGESLIQAVGGQIETGLVLA